MIYTINKNKHFAKGRILRLFNFWFGWKDLVYECELSEECWWSPKRNADDGDMNKLCGRGFGINHHRNSIRANWKPDFENTDMFVFTLYGYAYDENGWKAKEICKVKAKQRFIVRVRKVAKKYIVSVNGKCVELDNLNKDKNWGKELYPYVGGDNKAIRRMEVYVKRLKNIL